MGIFGERKMNRLDQLSLIAGRDVSSIALCSWNIDLVENDRSYIDQAIGKTVEAKQYAFCFRSQFSKYAATLFEAGSDSVASFVFVSPVRKFDILFLGRSVRLYPSNWYEVLCHSISRSIREGGFVAIGAWSVMGESLPGGMPLEWFTKVTGAQLVDQGNGYFYYQIPVVDIDDFRQDRPSMYTWYRRRGPAVFASMGVGEGALEKRSVKELGFRVHSCTSGRDDEQNSRYLVASEEHIAKRKIPEPGSFATLESGVFRTAYLASYLCQILKPLVRRFGQIDYLDHGSGTCGVPFELLLDASISLRSAVAVEPTAYGGNYFTVTADAYQTLKSSFNGEFSMYRCQAEDFRYPQRFHAISFCGMLVYVDKKKRAETIKAAWNALYPGGLLIVYEPQKRDSHRGINYYEDMLTLAEIEDLLSRFGSIVRYHERDIRTCEPDELRDIAVFRVVKKGG